MKKHFNSLIPVLFLCASVMVNAQFTGSYGGAWSTTWNNPASSLASVMIQGMINKKMLERSIANQRAGKSGASTAGGSGVSSAAPGGNSPTVAPTSVNYSVLQFRPVANSGVAKQIADAVGSNAQERTALLQIFQEIKKSYEAEVAKDGKSNNIAAALTFFMTSASMAYHQTDEPAESTVDALLGIMEQEMGALPDFKKMTDREKQNMHDWLVVSGGFVLAGYLDAVQKNDSQQLADYRELANGFFKLVLGTGVEKFNLAEIGSSPASVDAPVIQAAAGSPASASTGGAAIHAADLVKEFESNEVRANQMYVGKRVRIRGTVNSIEAVAGGNIRLIFNRSALTYTNVRCHIDKSQASRVAAVNANDELTVDGTVRGLGGGALGIKAYLVIENCSLP